MNPKIKTQFTNTDNERVTVYDDGTKTRQEKGIELPKVDDVISSASTTPSPDFKITTQPPATEATGMLGGIKESTDTFTENLKSQREDTQKGFNETQGDLQSFIKGLKGETGLTSEAYSQENGVDTVQTELNDINQKIREEQRALTNKLDALEKNPQGLFGGALSDEMSRIERESLKTQADLSIIQQGVQGRYDSAKAIADRAVSAYLEKQDLELKALEFNYQENKDLFTKAEQREFETAQADRTRRLDAEKKELTDIYELALSAQKEGAPSSVVDAMLKSKTKEEALKTGGSYIGAQDRIIKDLQIQGLRKELEDKESAEVERTQSEWAALTFGERTLDAESIIDELGSQFSTISGAVGSTIPYSATRADRKRFDQAERNFINAVLRRESGATISPEEFENARQQYIPQVNDSAELLLQKKQNRNLVTRNYLKEGKADSSVQDRLLEDPLQLGISLGNTDPLGVNK